MTRWSTAHHLVFAATAHRTHWFDGNLSSGYCKVLASIKFNLFVYPASVTAHKSQSLMQKKKKMSRGQSSFHQEETLSRTWLRFWRPPADGQRRSSGGGARRRRGGGGHIHHTCKYIRCGLAATLFGRRFAAQLLPERHESIFHEAAERT